LDRALAKSRDERFPDAAAFLAAIDQLEQQLMAAGGRLALRATAAGLGPWEARGQAAGGFLDRVSRQVQPILERSWHILRVRILPPMAASVKRVLIRRHGRRPPVSPTTRRLVKDVEPTPELSIKPVEKKRGPQPPEIPSDAMVTHDARDIARKE
jgi:DNA-binding helix-hairpin-helix protein with protein kinase domain